MTSRHIAIAILYFSAAALAALAGLDGRSALLLRNSLLLAAGTSCMAIPVGSLLAVLLAKTNPVGKNFAIGLLAGMLLFPLYLHVACWEAAVGKQGWLTLAAGSFAQSWLAGWRACIWVHALAAVPWVALLVGLGMRFVEPELEESALLDASPFRVFFRLTLPRSAAALAAALVWIFVTTFGEMTATNLYMVRTYTEELYTGLALGEGISSAWRMLPGVLVVSTFVSLALALASSFSSPQETPTTLTNTYRRSYRSGFVVWLLLFLIAAIPILAMIVQAGMEVTATSAGPIRRWSGWKLWEVLTATPGRFGEEIGWSLQIGAVSSTLALLLGLALAWPARRGGLLAAPALVAAAFCLSMPGPLVGLGLISLLNQPDWPGLIWLYDRTILPPVLAITLKSLPISILVLWFGFRTLSQAALDAAQLEGAGQLRRLLLVGIPQRWPAICVAWLAALAVSLGDLSASILVLPPSVSTVPVRLFGLMHAGVDDYVAGLAMVCTLGFALIATLALWLWKAGSTRFR